MALGPVAAGKKASAALTTRAVGVPAGEVTVVGTSSADPGVVATVTAAYGAASCG
jgi:hypothetical protein